MPSDAVEAVHNAHIWFETNSGWAPPDEDTLAEWMADGVCRCPDECLVAPDGWCQHGLASWWLVLSALEGPTSSEGPVIGEAHRRAVEDGQPGYVDPVSGLFVMTAAYLAARGSCCEQSCRHCPF